MARVHLFTSSTQPYHYKRNVDTTEEPLLLSSEDMIDNTTISEAPATSLDIVASPSHHFITAPSSPEQESLTNQLKTSSAALTAALLQNAHNNDDVVGAVAAVLSVRPDTFHQINQSQQGQDDSSAPMDMCSDKKEDVIDQTAAAATALQLLGLSSQNDSSSNKEDETQQQQPNQDNIMLIANYPSLTSNLEEIDLNSEDMMQDYKRGTWTREEDELLLSGIKRFGYGRWKEIATSIPGRKGKQLKQRWDNTLAAKYVDQEWLRNKIKNEQVSSMDKQQEDKALRFLEATDWNDIALKITEKAREGDQHAIEVLLSQALLGTVTSKSTSSSPHDDSNPSTPTTSNDALGLNFTRSPIDPNNPPSIHFGDAAALALYAQQLSNNNTTNAQSLAALANHPYFLTNPFSNPNDSISAAAAAAAAQPPPQQPSPTPIVGQKRRRSDPALADTQSAAMSIYASAAPITTTINNQTQTVYPCLFPNCGKTFARLYNLKSHSRTHTDDRPFVCHACTAAFSRNHDLKRHSKIHGGDKPYRCEGCKKSFSRLDALKRHKSNQRNNKQGCTED